ncbi:hypothetical protein EDB81DRAFT_411415 [Dactylonectria macrodidyma]|uniref:Mitotic apparatus protein p62 n=1 Tax=Dactylonectria macrodidyma TaxID=307937 RepID=A0A9P9JE02_9HYPO|nr:hypothetical protein EDB81DRAFT_411415 [Dactylonectria macrodidyma]
MVRTRILRFPRSDDESAFVLVQVTPKGSRALDLKLVGTEGEAPYNASCKSSHCPLAVQYQIPVRNLCHALTHKLVIFDLTSPVVKQDRAASLRVKNCPASEPEWQGILESLFTQEPLPGIQATATVQSEASISITIRKETQGITQRLGAITLNYDPDEAIELFEWCGAAVEASAVGKQTVADLRVKSHDSEAAVAQLQSQLEELIQAKDKDETVLLQKFRDLLNEKKMKIREQQLALAASSLGSSHPESSQPQQATAPPKSTRPSKPARKAGQSRAMKRKAPASKIVEEDSDNDVGDQAMDVDIKQELEDTDPGNTTEGTASEASGDDDDNDAPPPNTAGSASHRRTEPPKLSATEKAPPPRNLPFNKKPAPAPAGSETDSDDEL